MNCVIIKNGDRLIVNLTLSERNIEALKTGPIDRITETQDGVKVTMVVKAESDQEHYYSSDRDEQFRGIAGGLHRFNEDDPVLIEREV